MGLDPCVENFRFTWGLTKVSVIEMIFGYWDFHSWMNLWTGWKVNDRFIHNKMDFWIFLYVFTHTMWYWGKLLPHYFHFKCLISRKNEQRTKELYWQVWKHWDNTCQGHESWSKMQCPAVELVGFPKWNKPAGNMEQQRSCYFFRWSETPG